MEGKRIAIIDKDGGKLLDVVESTSTPGVFGIVALNPDGSSVTWGGGWGGHVIQEEGVSLTQRSKLNFVGSGVTATDDAGNDATVVTIPSTDVSGFVTWPASATDNAVARFDSTTGKLVQNSSVTLDDSANFAGINEIHFTLSPTPSAYAEGTLRWNTTDKCLDIETGNGSTLQTGQEMFIRVRNATGVTITNGSLCYINGATGNRPTVALAKADAEATAHTLIGMATDDISNNADGFITVLWTVHDLDTSAYADGTELFLSETTSGAFTNVAPSAPNFVVKVGVVSRSNVSQGKILVQPQVRTVSASNIRGTVAVENGGTGLSALGSALQQLRVNAGGTALEYFTPSASGLSWNTAVNGATGTGLSLSLDNSYAASGIGQSITIGNTQTQALTGLSINTGTSAVGQIGVKINVSNASTSARWLVIDPSTTGTWYWMYLPGGWAAWYHGIHLANISAIWQWANKAWMYFDSVSDWSQSAYWIYMNNIATAWTTASYWMYISSVSWSSTADSVWFYIANLTTNSRWKWKFFSFNNAVSAWLSGATSSRSTDLSEIIHSRTNTWPSTWNVDDNFNVLNLKRQAVQNTWSVVWTQAGSVLRLENTSTFTSWTITDSVTPLLVVQGASSTGAPVAITQNAVVSTNYRRLFKETVTGITIWMGNGTTANGNLSGTAGDILFNGGSNKPEYCTGTTTWVALV